LPFISEAKVIFDVGGNAGYFSKEILESGFDGRIILFEPLANLIQIARANLSNWLDQITFENVALGQNDGVLNLYLPDDSNIGWITAVREKATSNKKIQVKVASALSYVEEFRPEFIKIDVEGFELEVLQPILEAISDSYRPTFLIELGWGVSNPYWEQFLGAASKMISLGYSFSNAQNGGLVLSLKDLAKLKVTIDVVISSQDLT
jgi:FkbM family methyltransferase